MTMLLTALLRLGVALVLGAVIGWERERGERAAGLRTNALVALGSCLAMLVSAFGFADVLGTHNVVLDPSRIAAQVISGIGFLGAGTILLRKEVVKGLTTAAAIWMVAAIGLACGAGLLLEAVIATIFTLIVLVFLQPLRQRIHPNREEHVLRIKVTAVEESLLGRVYDLCMEMGAVVKSVDIQTGNGKGKLEMTCTTNDPLRLTNALVALRTVPGMDSLRVQLNEVQNVMDPLALFADDSNSDGGATP